jgi:hypothetical protein
VNPFQPIINALARLWIASSNFFGRIFTDMWAGFVGMVEFFSAWVVSFFVNIFGYAVEFVVIALTFLVGLLPALPEAPVVGGAEWLANANRYLPVAEAVGLGVTWAVLYGLIMTYKLVKLLRGGG